MAQTNGNAEALRFAFHRRIITNRLTTHNPAADSSSEASSGISSLFAIVTLLCIVVLSVYSSIQNQLCVRYYYV